jgi:hypothetical protein
MTQRLSPVDRLAAGFLLVLLAAGSLTLWIGVPAGWLWIASKVTDSAGAHYFLAITGTPVAIIAFGALLAWVNGLYLRVAGTERYEPDEDDDDGPRFVRGPLEPLLIGSLAVAAVVMCVWFFVFAANPALTV